MSITCDFGNLISSLQLSHEFKNHEICILKPHSGSQEICVPRKLQAIRVYTFPYFSSLSRIGQLLATTLPSNRECNENSINLYEEGEDPARDEGTDHARFGRFHGDEGRQRRAIVLRNVLLDVLLSLLANQQLEINTKWVTTLTPSPPSHHHHPHTITTLTPFPLCIITCYLYGYPVHVHRCFHNPHRHPHPHPPHPPHHPHTLTTLTPLTTLPTGLHTSSSPRWVLTG